MKKLFFILFVFVGISSFAQTDYSTIVMKTDADYKVADKYALEASNYVLSKPLNAKDQKIAEATKFILTWMEGTPDYTFNIASSAMSKLVEENEALLGVFYAGMTKYSLDNPTKADDMKLVQLNGMKAVISYAEKSGNNVTISPTLKKLIEANKKGELEKALE